MTEQAPKDRDNKKRRSRAAAVEDFMARTITTPLCFDCKLESVIQKKLETIEFITERVAGADAEVLPGHSRGAPSRSHSKHDFVIPIVEPGVSGYSGVDELNLPAGRIVEELVVQRPFER